MKAPIVSYLAMLLLIFSIQSCSQSGTESSVMEIEEASQILIFSKTSGFRHESIPTGIAAIKRIAEKYGVEVSTTENAALFELENLKHYEAVVFLNTTQDVLDSAQQQAFEKYIKAGGGFVGIHAAADTEYDWPWYNQLVGAYLDDHSSVQQATVDVLNKAHPATAVLPKRWQRVDEWYNFRSINPDINILANLDEKTYRGGKHGAIHPIIWFHDFDGGRSFYTGLGHSAESYKDRVFLEHLWGGIEYAMGD